MMLESLLYSTNVQEAVRSLSGDDAPMLENPMYINGTANDDDEYAIKVDVMMQSIFGACFVFLFFLMICLSLCGRRANGQPIPEHYRLQDPEAVRARRERRKAEREERKKHIERALVVKHVIGGPTVTKTSEDDSAATESSGSEEEGEQRIADFHHQHSAGEESIGTGNSDSSSVIDVIDPRRQIVRRLKSNLILSDPDDVDATRDSAREPWICAICLAPYAIGDEICWSKNPDCNHVFHHECIEHWLYKHDECPMCRARFISFDDGDDDGDEVKSAQVVDPTTSEAISPTTTLLVSAQDERPAPPEEFIDLENQPSSDEQISEPTS